MFDRTVCLLLDKRIVHRERIRQEFAEHDIHVEFFLAGDGKLLNEQYDYIDGDRNEPIRGGYSAWKARDNSWNAFQCFRRIIEQAKSDKWDEVDSLLILEDDASLTPEFGEVLPKALAQLKEVDPDWHMLYLGANHTFSRTQEVAPNLLRLNGSGCWHSVVLRRAVFDAILALPVTDPIDGQCGKLIHPHYRCYACWPSISIPIPGFSHCEGRDVDYRDYFSAKGC